MKLAKKQIQWLVFLTAAPSFAHLEDSFFKNSIQKAEEFFHLRLYEDSLPHYQHAVNFLKETTNDQELEYKIRLAETYFFMESYPESLEILQHCKAESETLNSWIFFLKSLVNSRISESFSIDTSQTSRAKSHKFSQFLQATSYFKKSEFEQAKRLFDYLKSENCDPKIKILCDLHQIKIAQASGNQSEVEKIFEDLSNRLASSDPYFVNFLLLKGAHAFKVGNYDQAFCYFERALGDKKRDSEPWIQGAVDALIDSYLAICKNIQHETHLLKSRRKKIEELLVSHQKKYPTEKNFLALMTIFFLKAHHSQESEAKERCYALLSHSINSYQAETIQKAMLIQAELTSDGSEKEQLLQEIPTANSPSSPTYALSLLAKGLHYREEANRAENPQKKELLKQAIHSFKTSTESLHANPLYLIAALKLLAKTCIELSEIEYLKDAISLIGLHRNNQALLDHTSELTFQAASIKCAMYHLSGDHQILSEVVKDIESGHKICHVKEQHQLFFLLGKIHLLAEEVHQAKLIFSQIITNYPDSPLIPESLFWLGKNSTLEKERQLYYKRLYQEYPTSAFAAEACYRLYEPALYLHGNKNCLKHLEDFIAIFPNHPLTINGLFLIGLDAKRTQKIIDGKLVRKQHYTKAIDQFQKAETLYQMLESQQQISAAQQPYYRELYYRAILERADANSLIGKESADTKHEIYLKYAENVYKVLLTNILKNNDQHTFRTIYYDSLLRLAQTLFEENQFSEAQTILTDLLEVNSNSGFSTGYHLSRAWNLFGMIALANQDYSEALAHFIKAEETAEGILINSDEQLDQQIKISCCLKHLGEYNQAMLQLSKVINADVISGLRIKAMILRAEIYKLQGRVELARKQLEAVVIKGGEWGKQAKEQLVKDYGHY